jgi:hypothetical protein
VVKTFTAASVQLPSVVGYRLTTASGACVIEKKGTAKLSSKERFYGNWQKPGAEKRKPPSMSNISSSLYPHPQNKIIHPPRTSITV